MVDNSLAEIKRVIHGARKVLLVSHIMPDGDTIGSVLGLAWALRARGIEARVSCADPVPTELGFLPGVEEFAARQVSDEDAVLVIDASDLARIGAIYDAAAFSSRPVVNIDHHATNVHYGTINYVDPTAAATAELIFVLVRFMELPITFKVATCLLTGLVMDTLCFRTSSTTSQSLRTAVALMEAGASLPHITDAAFNHRSTDVLRLWGPALTNARVHDGIAWTIVSQPRMRKEGIDPAASSGLVNFMNTLHEARVAALFSELEDGSVEVSLRSSPDIDIASVALSLGGGGHPQAAGCTLPGPTDEAVSRTLAAVRVAMTAIGSADSIGDAQ